MVYFSLNNFNNVEEKIWKKTAIVIVDKIKENIINSKKLVYNLSTTYVPYYDYQIYKESHPSKNEENKIESRTNSVANPLNVTKINIVGPTQSRILTEKHIEEAI